MTGDDPAAETLSNDERAELLRLRAEVTQLRQASGGAAVAHPRTGRRGRWSRSVLATVLIVVSCLLAPLSTVAVWLRGEVTDTDRYVETVTPLAKDPVIQRAITADLTDIVFTYIDVRGLAQQALTRLTEQGILPPDVTAQMEALVVPLSNGVRSFAEGRILEVVRSDVFAQAWVQANRAAHQQLVSALTGDTSGGVIIEGDTVKVNLAPFLAVVKERLVSSGFELASRVPEVNATFVVFESPDVGKAQQWFSLLDTLGLWLPVILIALAGFGIYLAPNHRLAFIGTGLGVALAMLAGAVGLALLRRSYLDGLSENGLLPPDAAAVLLDTIVRFLREALRAAVLAGVLVALGGFLTGPSVTASTVRRWLTTGFAYLRGWLAGLNVPLTATTQWVSPRARALRAIAVACAVAVVLIRRYKTPELVVWTTIALLAVLAVIEFLAVQPRRTAPRPVDGLTTTEPIPAR